MKTKPAQLASLFAMAGLSCIVVLLSPAPAMAMHIAEGYLPIQWAAFWWLIAIPFLLVGWRSLTRITLQLSSEPPAWPRHKSLQDQCDGDTLEPIPGPTIVACDSLTRGLVCMNTSIQPQKTAQSGLTGDERSSDNALG